MAAFGSARRVSFRRLGMPWVAVALIASLAGPASAAQCSRTSVGLTPITDLGTGTYQGSQGGLYPQGRNVPRGGHGMGGLALA
jgi:hypothetical protein